MYLLGYLPCGDVRNLTGAVMFQKGNYNLIKQMLLLCPYCILQLRMIVSKPPLAAVVDTYKYVFLLNIRHINQVPGMFTHPLLLTGTLPNFATALSYNDNCGLGHYYLTLRRVPD